MKVAFWSSTGIEGGATVQMAVISLILKHVFRVEVVISCNYVSDFMPEHCLLPETGNKIYRKRTFQYSYGESAYLRNLWELNNQLEVNVETMLGAVTIVPPPGIEAEDMFYYPVPDKTLYLMDVAPGAFSGDALEEADAVVIFLPQDRVKIQKFFDQYSSIIPKSLFLINDYRKEGDYFPRMLASKYQIKKENIGIFPYCTDFHRACKEGKVIGFLKSNLKCFSNNPNYYFISNLILNARLLKNVLDNCTKGKESVNR